MARTISSFLTDARNLLSDTRTPYRYSDLRLITALNNGLAELARIRPDAYYSTFDEIDIVVPEYADSDTDKAKTFPLGYLFYLPILEFVVGFIELSDDEFTQDGRAAILLQKFELSVTGR